MRIRSVVESVRIDTSTQIARVRDWYNGLTPGRQKAARLSVLSVLVGGLFALLIGLANWAITDNSAPTKPSVADPSVLGHIQPSGGQVTSTLAQQKLTPYTVQKGEFIISIAAAQGVPWESIVIANETELAARAMERCGKLSEKYRKNHRRRGHYCNELIVINGKPMMSANSLQPGDVLQIPSTVAPAQIQQTITSIPGNRIVVVIDDTGSMRGEGDGMDDRERVSAWYLQAVRNSGKQIIRVIMYADGYYRELDTGQIEFHATGGFENTRGALERAATYKPDAIVLITDEPGDDWNDFVGLRLPLVIAHSLNFAADNNMAQVARLSGGQFLRSHSGALVLATTNL